ncbi:hypothetical protein I7I48_11282 [Histoplasma ohiense]|nr:hypothetical protein I7I48_11282 [Histoplasma ohiense (nom. inval.)]
MNSHRSFTSLFNHVPWDKSQTWFSDHLVFHFHQPAAQFFHNFFSHNSSGPRDLVYYSSAFSQVK